MLRLVAPGNGDAVCLPSTEGGTDCTVPTLMDKLRVQASPTQLVFTWVPHPADPAPSGYTAEYWPPGGPWTAVPASGTTATITGLTPGAEYSFLVRTTDSPTSPRLYYVATLPALVAPANLGVTAGNGRLDLRWTAPTGTVTGYDVHYKTTAAPDQRAPATDPTTGWVAVTRSGTTPAQAIPGLRNGTAYAVRVRATNADGMWITSPSPPRRPACWWSKPPAPPTPSARCGKAARR